MSMRSCPALLSGFRVNLRTASWAIVLFIAAFITTNTAAAHDGIHRGGAQVIPVAAKLTDLRDTAGLPGGAIGSVVQAPVRETPGDTGCLHGPLHVFCVAAPSCSTAEVGDAFDPMSNCTRLMGHRRNAPVAGLAPPPLDRPPR